MELVIENRDLKKYEKDYHELLSKHHELQSKFKAEHEKNQELLIENHDLKISQEKGAATMGKYKKLKTAYQSRECMLNQEIIPVLQNSLYKLRGLNPQPSQQPPWNVNGGSVQTQPEFNTKRAFDPNISPHHGFWVRDPYPSCSSNHSSHD